LPFEKYFHAIMAISLQGIWSELRSVVPKQLLIFIETYLVERMMNSNVINSH
jgi:hypothetical protein